MVFSGLWRFSVLPLQARTIARLVNPNIVRVLDFDVHQGQPFLVLDYVSGGTLRQRHPRGTRVSVSQVVSYVWQIAEALDYAHGQKLIHRDVKPENMLLSVQGDVLLSDFGIATIAHATSSMSMQAAMGTLAYMAPEQIQGQPRAACDQYALAVTAYHWFSGRMPFEGSFSLFFEPGFDTSVLFPVLLGEMIQLSFSTLATGVIGFFLSLWLVRKTG